MKFGLKLTIFLHNPDPTLAQRGRDRLYNYIQTIIIDIIIKEVRLPAVNQSINEAEVNEASDSNFCKIKYMIIEYILEYYEFPDLHPRNQEHPRKSGQMTKPMIAQFGDSEKCLI